MPSIGNLVHETTTGTGTGNLDLSNVNGKRSFNTSFGNGSSTDVFWYFISHRTAAEWEVGTGHMSDSDTLVRDTVISSSNSNNAVNFAAGTKDVTNDVPVSARREVLTAARTYYVRTDGSDSNDGLADTSGRAFLTIQKAIDVVAALDTSTFSVAVNVAAGTYTGAVVLKDPVGAGSCSLTGDTSTPSNVVISTTSATAITASNVSKWTVQGFKLTTTTSGDGIAASNNAVLNLGAMEYGAIGGSNRHMSITSNATVNCNANYTISGNAVVHWLLTWGGQVVCVSRTITLSGTPAFSSAFVSCARGSKAQVNAITFSGSATGVRFLVNQVSIIFTNGGGANYFPGNSAGTEDTTTSGHYI